MCVFVASNAENRDSFHPMRREKRGRVSFLLSDDVQDVREAGKEWGGWRGGRTEDGGLGAGHVMPLALQYCTVHHVRTA